MNSDISILKLTSQYLEPAIEFATEVFVQKEPMAKAIAITYDDIKLSIADIVKKSCSENLGLIALSPSNKIISFVFSASLTSSESTTVIPPNKVKSIFLFLDKLTESYFKDTNFTAKKAV